MALSVAVPSSICAVTGVILHRMSVRHAPSGVHRTVPSGSVGQWKKCRVPVRYIVTPAASAASTTSSSRTEPPGCTTAAHAGVEQDLQAVGEREERVGGGDRAARPARPPASTASRAGVDPVDLAHADADRGAVRGQQDRVGLHRAAGPPGEREVGERSRRRRPRRWRASRSPGRRRAASTGRACLHAAGRREIGRNSTPAAGRVGRQTQQPDVLLAAAAPRARRPRSRARRRPR